MTTQLPKDGSKWTGGDRKVFTVINTVVIEDNTWIHYRDDRREYSCFVESFLQRFIALPE